MRTTWVSKGDTGATLGELFRALGQEQTFEPGKWWSDYLDTETQLRLVEGKATHQDTHRVWDEASRLAHTGRFAFNDA